MYFESEKKTSKFIYPTLLVILLTACEPNKQVTNISQIVAKVNGDTITVSQLNAELHVNSESVLPSIVSAKVLENMIGRQLLVQEAIKLNLDRIPEVQEAVASAKAQIYAQTYIAKKLTKAALPTEKEIKQFVLQHPHYFLERKIYITEDIIFENYPKKLDLAWLEANVTTVDELKFVLSEKGIQYHVAHNQFATDSLSNILLERINHVKTGDLLFAHDDNKVVIKLVTTIVPSRVSEADSMHRAAKRLVEKRNQEFVSKEIARLKSLAKVEILDPSLKLAPNELLSKP